MAFWNPSKSRPAAIAAVAACLISFPVIAADPPASGPAVETVPPTAPAPANDFNAFRVLWERNIFDPNRRKPSERTTRVEEKPAAPQVDIVSFAGTLSYGDRNLAFFDSTVAEFKKAVSPGDALAGFAVRLVTPDRVELTKDETTLGLKVGQQLRREDGGEWQVTSGLVISSASGGGAPAVSGGDSGSNEGDASDALKRLLEKRKKESGQ